MCIRDRSPDEKFVYCTNAGENTVSIYSRDEKSGLLTMICCLPVSGEYPKAVSYTHLDVYKRQGLVLFKEYPFIFRATVNASLTLFCIRLSPLKRSSHKSDHLVGAGTPSSSKMCIRDSIQIAALTNGEVRTDLTVGRECVFNIRLCG